MSVTTWRTVGLRVGINKNNQDRGSVGVMKGVQKDSVSFKDILTKELSK